MHFANLEDIRLGINALSRRHIYGLAEAWLSLLLSPYRPSCLVLGQEGWRTSILRATSVDISHSNPVQAHTVHVCLASPMGVKHFWKVRTFRGSMIKNSRSPIYP